MLESIGKNLVKTHSYDFQEKVYMDRSILEMKWLKWLWSDDDKKIKRTVDSFLENKISQFFYFDLNFMQDQKKQKGLRMTYIVCLQLYQETSK